jgi:cobalt-zinc-cadmium efflux system membrane fusion protein
VKATAAGALLLISVVLVGCTEKQGSHESSRESGAPKEPEQQGLTEGGHAHEEGTAPHGHDESSGPVVTLTAIERANIGLKTEAVASRRFEDVRRLPGVMKAMPGRVALVTSRTPGKVVDIHAALGERVTKGEDLIEIQSVEVEKVELDLLQTESRSRTEILKLETDLNQARNRLRLAQADADRNRLLVDKGIGARKDLIAAENQLQAVQYEIGALERQIELARLAGGTEAEGLKRQLQLLGVAETDIERLRRERVVTVLHLPAPIAGIVVDRPAVLGQAVEPTTRLLKLVDTSVLIAEGAAPEDLLPELKVGQPVRITVPAYPGRRFDGRVTFIHPQIDPDRRVARVWAEIPNPGGELKEDMFAQLSVVVGGGPRTLVIPAAALMSEGGLEFVFVETPAGFARTPVVVGARNDQEVEIKQGLSPGQKVVTDGKRQLYTVFLAARSGAPALGGHTH